MSIFNIRIYNIVSAFSKSIKLDIYTALKYIYIYIYIERERERLRKTFTFFNIQVYKHDVYMAHIQEIS